MENWINFDNIPRRKDGKYDWKNCNHNRVDFCYDGECGYFYLEKRIKSDSFLASYKDRFTTISSSGLRNIQLRKIKRMIMIADHKYNRIDNNINLFDINTVSYTDYSIGYKYCIGDILPLKQGNLKILYYIKIFDNVKGYVVSWLNESKNEFNITESALLKSDKWGVKPYYKIKPGVNDLWSTRPDIACCLCNYDDGFIYGQYSNKKVGFMCDRCGRYLGEKNISSVSSIGLSCKYCSDGISYPNKLMSNLLESLNISFYPEHFFDWCVFPKYDDKTKTSSGIYDFVIDDLKLIIEMDGGLGHGHNVHGKSRYSIDESMYRDNQKDLLALSHGYTVVRIDCNYNSNNKIELCRDNIINKLSYWFDLSCVDWAEINRRTANSYLLQSINLYNDGYEPLDISKLLNRDYTTILDYLHRGTELGMCEYISFVS